MSKIKLFLDVVEDLRSLADSVQAVVDAMSENDITTEKPAEPVATNVETAPAVTLEHVRTVLAEKSRDGLTDAVRELLNKYGAKKLSLIDSAKYNGLLKEAEALGNG